MSDDRPVEEVPDAIGALRRDFEDFKTTVLARLVRRPTGTIEVSLDATAKAGTLFLQGQTLTRTAYPDLWAWVSANGLAGTNLPFGTGDGTTTFVLPDLRGRGPVGADATNPVGKKFGSATVTLAEANLPLHGHVISGSINGVGDHDHGSAGTSQSGDHGGHTVSPGNVPDGSGAVAANDVFFNSGAHRHSLEWEGAHSHSHSLYASGTGSGTPVSVQPPAYAVNWLIWT